MLIRMEWDPGSLRWGRRTGSDETVDHTQLIIDAPGGPFQPTHSRVCESQGHAGSGWSGLKSASTS
jgi:hypothetical protein